MVSAFGALDDGCSSSAMLKTDEWTNVGVVLRWIAPSQGGAFHLKQFHEFTTARIVNDCTTVGGTALPSHLKRSSCYHPRSLLQFCIRPDDRSVVTSELCLQWNAPSRANFPSAVASR